MLRFPNMASEGPKVSLTAGLLLSLAALFLAPTANAADYEDCENLFLTGQYQAAYEMATKAIEDYAYQEEWRHLLVKTMMVQGRYREAQDTIVNTISRYPTSVRARQLGYDVFLANGNTARSESLLKEIDYLVGNRSWAYREAPNLVSIARTALLLGADPKNVLDSFLSPAKEQNDEVREAWMVAGKLALGKNDFQTAAEEFKEGARRFPEDPDFHWGVAMSFAESDMQIAMESLNKALTINTNHVPSLLMLVDYGIDAEDYEQAAEGIGQILAINPHHPLAWSYQALMENLKDSPKGEARCLEEATRFWPGNPEVPHLIGKKLSQKYRFKEGSEYQKKALALDPGHSGAKIQLAQDLLRLGDDTGWKLAKEVHEADAYDVIAYNLVTLADVMGKFETLENEHFLVRMSPREAAIYGDQVLSLLTRAHKTLTEKYGIQLEEKTIIEIFPDQKDFAIRTFSLPGGAGFLGVCFGRVITANSPASQVDDPSNWEAVLWHEFAHVITLTLTRNKMPRWLSEGISVHEELAANPIWGQTMTPFYRELILGGELTPVSELSSAFLNPKSGEHLQFAYYESALVVEFLIKEYGIESLRAILRELGEGKEINTTIARHTTSMESLEKAFDAFARKRAKSLAPDLDWERPEEPPAGLPQLWTTQMHPKNYYILHQKAAELMGQEKWEEAKEPLKTLIEHYPNNAESDSPLKLLAVVHRKLEEREEEKKILKKLAAISADDVDVFERLMEMAEEEEDWKTLAVNGERYLAANPLNPRIYRLLAPAQEKINSIEEAARSWKAMLQMDPADPAQAHYKFAALIAQRRPEEARRHLLMALEHAPRFRDAHRILQSIDNESEASPDPEEATREKTASPSLPTPSRNAP